MAKNDVLSNKVTSKTEYLDRKVDLTNLLNSSEADFAYVNDSKSVLFGKKLLIQDIHEEFLKDKEDILDTEIFIEKGKLVAKLDISKEVQ